MSEDELGGVSKKQMRKAIQANLREQMQEGGALQTTKKWGNSQLKDYKAQMKDATKATLADGSKGTVVDKAKADAQAALKASQNKIYDAEKLLKDENGNLVKLNDKHYSVQGSDGKGKKISKINKQIQRDFKAKISKKTDKFTNPMSGFADTLSKLGTSATNIAAVFMQNEAIKGSTTSKKQLEPFQLDARTRRIMQRNQMYRQHATFV